ncbi:hypothetical protein EJF18_30867 [Clavispora lusitaniae]|uniref:CST complex subunit Stn1 N-terminal domain-containing protein n=2 Tax=Clavispora lusitaniae TaxID=36911 RepID=C4Y443_CLAL4|nr:uncharacterized protein CLUG_02415 [Clavispora lusitaniae ATCC 42720]KAF5211456.1 hypothetical protein E0198_002768 [Clavispora lusitaniae]EEQ38289.1 hypothetical protein CLUG_02415 [Clavispora lusitaniae ATCC 42720]KAF7580310.1 Telomere regulation protein Stn1 family protein [Clavispora lusitaniae]QFZ27876.1 hypothetical protein EJF14_30867 [Clavispora lusitaniae]QFZ32817.1 hypothetical protein EJF16_30867 [Clavispora lusitaniae]
MQGVICKRYQKVQLEIRKKAKRKMESRVKEPKLEDVHFLREICIVSNSMSVKNSESHSSSFKIYARTSQYIIQHANKQHSVLQNDMSQPHYVAPSEMQKIQKLWGKVYYPPSLFHLAPTYNRILPVAIRDILRARNLLEVYGVEGLEQHNQGFILINNYPVRMIQISGRLLWFTYKNFDQGDQRSNYNFLLLFVDDCSGDNSSICIKIQESCLKVPLAKLKENLLIEVTGTVSHVLDYEKQIVGTDLRILGNHNDFTAEIETWARILKARKLLLHPWQCVAEGDSLSRDSDEITELRKDQFELKIKGLGHNNENSSTYGSTPYYTASDGLTDASDSNEPNYMNTFYSTIESSPIAKLYSQERFGISRYNENPDTIDLTDSYIGEYVSEPIAEKAVSVTSENSSVIVID